MKQKEELKDNVEEAREKERNDESGEFMYWVKGPPWSWFIKKIKKNVYNPAERQQGVGYVASVQFLPTISYILW